MSTDNSVVVYYYADPLYKGDMTDLLDEIKHRGYRIVKGDNANELLFLFQVGRPIAVIYTLENKQSKASANYQMVSRRALDLLVPIVLVGPDTPSEGMIIVYPDGKKSVESHVPFHSIGKIITQFDTNPPSTYSRPPLVLNKSTIGKGKTLLAWRGNSFDDKPTLPARGITGKQNITDKSAQGIAENTSKNQMRETFKFKKPIPPAAVLAKPPNGKKKEHVLETKTSEIKDSSSKLSSDDNVETRGTVDRNIDLAESAQNINDELNINKLSKEKIKHSKQGLSKKIIAAVASSIVLTLLGVVFYIILKTSWIIDHSEKLESVAVAVNNDFASTVILPNKSLLDQKKLEDQKIIKSKHDETNDAGKNKAELNKAELNKVISLQAAEKQQAEKQQDDKVIPSPTLNQSLINDTNNFLLAFPGRFKKGTATFWFNDSLDEVRFLDSLAEQSDKEIIEIVGHPTLYEAEHEQSRIGISRAWAIEKYLTRKGIISQSVSTVSGDPVKITFDTDVDGKVKNILVEIVFN